MVDMSTILSTVFQWIAQRFSDIIAMLSGIYILPHVSLLTFFIVLAVMGMVISAIFVHFGASDDDD